MRPINVITLAFCAAIIVSPAVAQQLDPTQQLQAEWQAAQLAQRHAEDAIGRLIASYEARLQTAMEWLQQAQQSNDKR